MSFSADDLAYLDADRLPAMRAAEGDAADAADEPASGVGAFGRRWGTAANGTRWEIEAFRAGKGCRAVTVERGRALPPHTLDQLNDALDVMITEMAAIPRPRAGLSLATAIRPRYFRIVATADRIDAARDRLIAIDARS